MRSLALRAGLDCPIPEILRHEGAAPCLLPARRGGPSAQPKGRGADVLNHLTGARAMVSRRSERAYAPAGPARSPAAAGNARSRGQTLVVLAAPATGRAQV